ncbi:hypothetical protein [Polyangium spumosum]|uniref:Glycine-rich protein n=1 Tax=Polyangium spumosum TaxID=889282 RepID=A0A6N7PX07_9BACT|nr:hypothetical protein [Polyangium spumosum]MRG96618.1 hypothetical protein [Polyangium spumosum]
MNSISKRGTLLLVMYAAMAMFCMGCAAEASSEDDIASAEGASVADVDVADADELSTAEDASALSVSGWGGSCGGCTGGYGYGYGGGGGCYRGYGDFDAFRGPRGGYGVAGPGGAIGVGPRGNVGFVNY